MSFLHMLFAIAVTLRLVVAKGACVCLWIVGMTIIHMSVSFLLSWPTLGMVLASGFWALEWSAVRFLMLAVTTVSKTLRLPIVRETSK